MMRIADRVKETTGTTGTGTVTLGGAADGMRAFGASVSDGDQVPYCIAAGSEWEVGIGTYATSGNTLARSTVLASSNAGSLVAFSAGTKDVFLTLPAVIGAGGLLPLPFATTIALRVSGSMPTQIVSGALTFTADSTGALDGVQVLVDLIANGSNAPTFSGFREWDGSSGYNNTLNVRNCITFFRRGGATWYTINQQAGAPTETLPATAVTLAAGSTSGVVNVASANFTVGANGTLSGSVVVTPSDAGAGGTFTPTSRTISSGAPTGTFTYTPTSTGNKTISVTNDAGLTNPSSITYTSNAAPTVAGAPTALTLGSATSTTQPLTWTAPASNGGASITDYVVQYAPAGSGSWVTFADGTSATASATVTGLTPSTSYDYRVAAVNSVGTGAYSSTATGSTGASTAGTVTRLTSTAGLTESGDGTAGWNYVSTATDTGYSGSHAGASAVKIASGGDGWFAYTVGGTTGGGQGGAWIGFKATTGAAAFTSGVVGVYIDPSANAYRVTTGGTGAQIPDDTGVTPASGDMVRVRRAGSTAYAEVSKNSGVTWATIKTWTGITTADVYCLVCVPSTTVLANNIRSNGAA